MTFAACGPRDRTHDTGAAPGGGPGTETGAMSDTTGAVAQPDMTRDTTGMGGMPADTASGSLPADSGQQSQTQSGVTDSSGKSTLGKDAQKTRPDQSQPVTSKGDTINPGVDSAK
jgi:hypothetical protein